MAAICEYQHKKFNLKSEEHSNRKLSLPVKKRKLNDMDKENVITAQTILENAQKDIQPEQPLAKRRQTKPLFRPWLDEDSNEPKTPEETRKTNVMAPQVLSIISTNTVHHHATKSLKEKEQQKRYRNSLAYLIKRRNEQLMQQQCMAQQQLQAAMMNQSVTTALYLRHLQQMALQRQQQLFVFGAHY